MYSVISIINWCNNNAGFAEWVQALSIITSAITAVIVFIKYINERKHFKIQSLNNKNKKLKLRHKELQNNQIKLRFSYYFDYNKDTNVIKITSVSGKKALDFVKLIRVFFTYNKDSLKFVRKLKNKEEKASKIPLHTLNPDYVKPRCLKKNDFISLNETSVFNDSKRTSYINIPANEFAWALIKGLSKISQGNNSSLHNIPYDPYITLVFEDSNRKFYTLNISLIRVFMHSMSYKLFKHLSCKYLKLQHLYIYKSLIKSISDDIHIKRDLLKYLKN